MTMNATQTPGTDSEAIRATSARWLEAVSAGDPNRVAAFYADDGMFLVPNAPLTQGHEAVSAIWGHLLGAPNMSLSWATSTVEVAQSADLACETGTYRLEMDGPAGRIEDDGKYVVVWRKRSGEWKVAADIFNSSRPLPVSS